MHTNTGRERGKEREREREKNEKYNLVTFCISCIFYPSSFLHVTTCSSAERFSDCLNSKSPIARDNAKFPFDLSKNKIMIHRPFPSSLSLSLFLSFSLITIHSSKLNKSSCLDDSLHFSLISWFVIK